MTLFKKVLFTTAAVLSLSIGTAPANAHNGARPQGRLCRVFHAYGSQRQPRLQKQPGCRTADQGPDGVTDAKAAFDPGLGIEYKMRTLETPIMAHGREVNEVVGEIVWKNPVKTVPANGWYPFKFRMTLPDEPGKVFHVQNITVCEEGTDPYVDLPEVALISMTQNSRRRPGHL